MKSFNIKRTIAATLTAAMLTTSTAGLAESATSALDAFNALTGQSVSLATAAAADPHQSLVKVMAGQFAAAPTEATAAEMSKALPELTGVGMRDIASYSAKSRLPVAQVRNAYYKALANTLRAEIMVNPASEERYRNVQVILQLFLTEDDAPENAAVRDQIRQNMDRTSAQSIADGYQLPAGFVEFIVMDDNWNDDRWDNDEDWRSAAQPADPAATLRHGASDSQTGGRVSQLQQMLIALGYLSGMADGIFGGKTEDALIEYQLANGHKATGKMDDDDWDDMLTGDLVARWDYEDDFDDWMEDDGLYDDLYDDDVRDDDDDDDDDWDDDRDDDDDWDDNDDDDWDDDYDDDWDDDYDDDWDDDWDDDDD